MVRFTLVKAGTMREAIGHGLETMTDAYNSHTATKVDVMMTDHFQEPPRQIDVGE
jgi:hypothetical protein